MSLTVAIDARLVGTDATGDATYWTGLLDGLARLRTDLRFLLYSNVGKPPGIPESPSFAWRELRARSGRWWSLVAFPLAARRAGARALHTQYTLSPLAKGGVTTIHDVSFLIGPEWFRPRDRRLLTATVPGSAARARVVIAVSRTAATEIERFLPGARGKLVVTPNACPPWIRPLARAEARARVEAETGVTGPYLLTVGARWPRKNMELALRAAERLPRDLPHRLMVTGKPGWGEERLGERGHATGYVSPEMLSALYSAADLYLAPSHHEGFGIPVLEAFRCGCPVLASAGGALPEVVGDAGVVEPSWAPDDWARAAEALLRDAPRREELARRGRERESLFTWEETARLTAEAYRRAASTGT